MSKARELAINYAYGNEEDFKNNANQFDCERRVAFEDGYNSREAMAEVLKIYKEALENCTGGDLSSGEGIYKAEIAREALAKAQKILDGSNE